MTAQNAPADTFPATGTAVQASPGRACSAELARGGAVR